LSVPCRSPARTRAARRLGLASPLAAPAPALALALVLVLLGGCTQSALVGLNDGPRLDAAVTFDGPGFVDGRLHAHAVFDYVDSVYWFGGDNDPARIELFIYQDAATCEQLSTSGWITRVRPTDLMGITVGGTAPGAYAVVPEKPPGPGNAYLLHVIDQADPVIESEGQGGTVFITSVKPGESVSGNFEATFSTGTLQGAFNATWCPTGVGL
jgi:hypothetical protein